MTSWHAKRVDYPAGSTVKICPELHHFFTAFSTASGPSHIISHLNCSGLPTGLSASTLVPHPLLYFQHRSHRNHLGLFFEGWGWVNYSWHWNPWEHWNMFILHSKSSLAPLSFSIKAEIFGWSQAPPHWASITPWPHLVLLFLLHTPPWPHRPPNCYLDTPGLLLPLNSLFPLLPDVHLARSLTPLNITGELSFLGHPVLNCHLPPPLAPSISYSPSSFCPPHST